MVFIRPDGVVHRIEENTEPFSEEIIASKGKVAAVLELAGGVARELGLKPGDRVEGRWFKPAERSEAGVELAHRAIQCFRPRLARRHEQIRPALKFLA